MKYKAYCSYCISQICNLYPNREENRFMRYFDKTYIEVETETEQSFIELVNIHMKKAHEAIILLENYLEDK